MNIWLELLIRSTVLLLATGALRWLYRTRRASLRHRLVLGAFVALAALPILSLVLPEIVIPLWPARQTRADVSIETSSYTVTRRHQSRPVNWPVVIWLAGVAVACMPMCAGAAAARRLVRRAKPVGDERWQALLGEVVSGLKAHKPELLVSETLDSPITFGALRPRIVLPAAAATWSTARCRAVLLHEVAHIRRFDVSAQLAAHLVAALWWFQPLVWILKSSLRAESELACDAEALASGFRPSDYAAELLAIAKSARRAGLLSSVAISMARKTCLEARVRAVLNPPAFLFSQPRIGVAVLALTAFSVAASTVSLKSDQFESGGFTMKRSLLSGLLTSAGLSAATISGSLFDPSGLAVPDARVSLSNPDTGAKQEATSGPDGKFALEDAPAGQYILRVEKPGLHSLLRVLDVKADAKIDRGFTLGWGTSREMNELAPADSKDKRIRVGGEMEQSNLVRKVQPVYPSTAKAAHLQGKVELEADISKDGTPTEIRVVSSPGDDLSQSALEAVRQWRYRPVLLNGQPTDIVTDILVNYTLSQ